MKIFKTVILIAFYFLVCSCFIKQEDPLITETKQTAQNVFRFYQNKEYDSLRLIAPHYLQSMPDTFLRENYEDIGEIIKADGIPELSDFRVRFFDSTTKDFCTLMLIPKSRTSADSIMFKFDKFNGTHKIHILWAYDTLPLGIKLNYDSLKKGRCYILN